ncbi:hypothetical protein WA026_022442 [Henosepilachna vigintioctopunctata]|uniref:Helix-turn-helix domain-containing protein n=1 Tax=Henosepilachna vigintioctopunctata TaxID=420089 RepID=A0AAW1U4B6_9CUCU
MNGDSLNREFLSRQEKETQALFSSPLKPKCWLRYVDDIFAIWPPHGRECLDNFLLHLNSIHPSKQFTIEVKNNMSLPFLDVMTTKLPTQGFSHSVFFRKSTHTYRYLNVQSHHQPSQHNSVIRSLISRSIRLSDNTNRQTELNFLKQVLSQNGYNNTQINSNILNSPILAQL